MVTPATSKVASLTGISRGDGQRGQIIIGKPRATQTALMLPHQSKTASPVHPPAVAGTLKLQALENTK